MLINIHKLFENKSQRINLKNISSMMAPKKGSEMKSKALIEEDLEFIKSSGDTFLIAFYKEFRKINKKKKSIQVIEGLLKEKKAINEEQKKLLDQKNFYENQYEFYSNIYELYKNNKNKKVIEDQKVPSKEANEKEDDKSYVMIEKVPIEEQFTSGIKRLANFFLVKHLISQENKIDFNPHPSATFIKDQKDINSMNHLYDLLCGFQGDKGILFPNEEERVMDILKNIMINSKSEIPNHENTFEGLNTKIHELASNNSFRSSTIIIHSQEPLKQKNKEIPKTEVIQGESIKKPELKLDKTINSNLVGTSKELNPEIMKANKEEIKEKNIQISKTSGMALQEEKKQKEKPLVIYSEGQKDQEEDEDDFNYVGKKENGFNIVKKGAGRYEARGRGGKYKGTNPRNYRNFNKDE